MHDIRSIFDAAAPPFVIAEVAQAHDGSLGMAHAFIDAAADAGAAAIKFQTHIAAAESTPGEPWRVKFSRQDATRYAYWQRMEFSAEQWVGLKAHADDKGIVFLSSPFSPEAVALLENVGVVAWKVGSGEVTNTPLLTDMARTHRPVLLSSGMASFAELDAAVNVVRAHGAPVALFQCTTAYPCPPEKLGLNVIDELRTRYPGVPVGFSDHSATTYAGLGAVALGARMVEVHVCFSHAQFGPDTKASLDFGQLKQLVEGARFLHQALSHPVSKDALEQEMGELKRIFGKSVVAARDLPAGHVLDAASVAFKKPGTGIPASRAADVIGKRLSRPVQKDTLLSPDDLAGALHSSNTPRGTA